MKLQHPVMTHMADGTDWTTWAPICGTTVRDSAVGAIRTSPHEDVIDCVVCLDLMRKEG